MSQLDLYRRHTGRLLGPLHRMSVRGVRYDERAAALLHTRLTAQRIDCEHKLTALTGKQLYAKEGLSNAKLKDYLYGDLGLPKQMRRRGKGEATITVDELAIRQLMVRFPKRDELQAAGALILKHREVATAARFVNDGLCDPDGRMRFGYSFNTEAFRLSSSSNPAGTGLNGQNIPHQKAHRACYLPEPGHLWLKVDLSQAESRSCYMYSGDPKLIALARTLPHEFDAHRHNAAIIFEKPHEQITKQERDVGKMAVHGSQRLMTGKTLADRLLLMLGIVRTPDECQAYIERYLDAHAGLRAFFREVRQTVIRDRALTNTWGRTWRVPYERFADELYRRACSFLMQSEIAEITNQWGVIAVDAYLRSQKMQSRLLVQVHDELGVSVHPDEVVEVMQFVRASLEQPRQYPAGELVIPAEFALGRSWAVEVEWKKFPSEDDIMTAVRSLT